MLGYVADLGFYYVGDRSLAWRLMLGSALIPAIPVLCLLFFVPESPRWYLSKNKYADAFNSMRQLRNADIQAARDVYLAVELLRAEEEVKSTKIRRNRMIELFSVPRNRKGVMASSLVMFMQQWVFETGSGARKTSDDWHTFFFSSLLSLSTLLPLSFYFRFCGINVVSVSTEWRN